MNIVFVTCFFDLRKREINIPWLVERSKTGKPRRTPEEYLQFCEFTLSINYPLVIYTDPLYFKIISDIRKKYDPSGNKTKIISKALEKYPTAKYIDKLFKIYKDGSMAEPMKLWPSKVTPYYCQVTWNKLHLIQRTIENKVFPMDRIYWIDFGLKYLEADNIDSGRYFEKDVLKLSDKITILQRLSFKPEDGMQDDWCKKMLFCYAGGFFGGSVNNMLWFEKLFFEEAEKLLKLGYGPLEEQIFPRIIPNHPDKFYLNYGNYQQVLYNIGSPRTAFNWIIIQFMTSARINGNKHEIKKMIELLEPLKDKFTKEEKILFLDEYFQYIYYQDKRKALNIGVELMNIASFDERINGNLAHVGLSLSPFMTNVTFVTMLYDLNKRENNLTRRSAESYLTHEQRTLLQKFPMIVYTDLEYIERIREIRKLVDPEEKYTLIIAKPLEEFKYQKYSEQIKKIWNLDYMQTSKIRDEAPWKWSATYTQLSWTKLDCLKHAIENNSFNTERFAWIDFGIGYLSDKNPQIGKDLYKYFSNSGGVSKIHLTSRCHVKQGIEDTHEYFVNGGFIIPGGFFDGPKDELLWFIEEFNKDVEDLLTKDYAPLEEQIFGRIYLKNKDRFEITYGNYWDMLDNLLSPQRGYSWIIAMSMERAINCSDYQDAIKCGNQLWPVRDKFNLDDLRNFLHYYFISVYHTKQEEPTLLNISTELIKSMKDCKNLNLILDVKNTLTWIGLNIDFL